MHNRLTHTIKVTAVARAIAVRLLRREDRDLLRTLGGLDHVVVQAAAAPTTWAIRRSATSASAPWTGWPGPDSGSPTVSRATPRRSGSSPSWRCTAPATKA